MSIKVYEAYRITKGHDPYDVLWSLKAAARRVFEERLVELYRSILDGRSERAAERNASISRLFEEWLKSQDYNPKTLPAHQVLNLFSSWEKEICPLELRGEKTRLAVTHRQILSELGRQDAEVEGARVGVYTIDQWFHKRYREQASSSLRSEWNFDASLTVRVYRGRYYLIPYVDSLNFLGNFLSFLSSDERLEDFAYWNNTDKPETVSTSVWRWRRTVWEGMLDAEQNFLVLDIVSSDCWHNIATSSLFEMMREFGLNSDVTHG